MLWESSYQREQGGGGGGGRFSASSKCVSGTGAGTRRSVSRSHEIEAGAYNQGPSKIWQEGASDCNQAADALPNCNFTKPSWVDSATSNRPYPSFTSYVWWNVSRPCGLACHAHCHHSITIDIHPLQSFFGTQSTPPSGAFWLHCNYCLAYEPYSRSIRPRDHVDTSLEQTCASILLRPALSPSWKAAPSPVWGTP